jgi:hypothetical protein
VEDQVDFLLEAVVVEVVQEVIVHQVMDQVHYKEQHKV